MINMLAKILLPKQKSKDFLFRTLIKHGWLKDKSEIMDKTIHFIISLISNLRGIKISNTNILQHDYVYKD